MYQTSGGNHLAKIFAKKCNGQLYEIVERLRHPVFEEEKIKELYDEILTDAKAPKKDGKFFFIETKRARYNRLICYIGFVITILT